MIIDKEGKFFGKISIIDIIVVLAIAVAAFGIYNRFATDGDKVATVTQRIEYKMLVKGVRQGTVDALSKHGQVIDEETKEYYGDIVDISYVPATGSEEMMNGEIKAVEIPDKFDVTVTVQLDGKINSSGYYTASNAPINIGSERLFYSKYAKTTGVITDIQSK